MSMILARAEDAGMIALIANVHRIELVDVTPTLTEYGTKAIWVEWDTFFDTPLQRAFNEEMKDFDIRPSENDNLFGAES